MTTLWNGICELVRDNMYFSLLVTLGGYFLGYYLQKWRRIALFNPLLISITLIIVSMKVFGIEYEEYRKDTAGLSYLLTPATICLAIPLYRQFELVLEHWRSILVAVCAGVLANILVVWGVVLAFHLDYIALVTFMTKSITTAIGVGVTEELGGNVPITCAMIALSGIAGNALGDRFLALARIREPIALGLGLGVASHGIGTARALELGETPGAFSGLAIALTGILTVMVAPFAARLPL